MNHTESAAAETPAASGLDRSSPRDPFDPTLPASGSAESAKPIAGSARPRDPRRPAWWKRFLKAFGRGLGNAIKGVWKMLRDPAEGPRRTLEELGYRAAGLTGVFYLLVQAVSLFLLFQILELFTRPSGESWLRGLVWHAVLAVAGPVFLAVGVWGTGLWGRHRPGLRAAGFVSGLTLLPAAGSIFWCAGLFAFSRELALAGVAGGFTLSILLLYHALLSVQGLSLRQATAATPFLLLASYAWTEGLWFCLLRFIAPGG